MVEMIMTVGPKGQVVIPKPIRDMYGIAPSDKVVFKEEKEGIIVSKQKSGAVEAFKRIALSGKNISIDIKKLKKRFENEYPKVKLS